MHILERIGAVAPFLEKALGWRFGRSYYRGEQIFRLEMPHPANEKYLPMYNLQQQYIEQYLHDAVAACDLIDMRWQSELSDIETGTDGVSLCIASPAGNYRLDADYVLAADGARSPIRSQLGLRMKGDNYEGRYVIADIRMDHDFPTERRAFFEPSGNPGGTVLIHKQPEDIWRVDYQLREGESERRRCARKTSAPASARSSADIGHDKAVGAGMVERLFRQHAVPRRLPPRPGVLHRRCRAYRADFWRARPQQWARGRRKSSAGSSRASSTARRTNALLDSYSPERRGATLDVFANATKSTRFMTPPTRGWRLAREAALSLSLKHEFPRGLANPRQMQPYTYSESPLTPYAGPRCRVCRRPRLRQRCAERQTRRRQLSAGSRRDGMTAILFCEGAPIHRTHRPARPARATLDKRFVALIGSHRNQSRQRRRRRDCPPVRRAPGTLYLLRPDLHIAGRWKTIAANEVLRTARLCLGRPSHEHDALRGSRNRL